MSDTKSQHKNKKFSKEEIAHKLEDLSNRVAARGIFVVRKNSYNQFDLFDYVHNRVIFDNLPSKALANKICDKFNNNKKRNSINVKKVRKLCTAISKHSVDCVFYLHTLDNSTDLVKRHATFTRLELSKAIIESLIKELKSVIS